MTGLRSSFGISALLVAVLVLTVDVRADVRAGAAARDITPPVGHELQPDYRKSVGVHEPLFARCLYLEDSGGSSVAIVCLDLILGGFEACDSLREEIREKTRVERSLINFSHSHASAALGPRGATKISNDASSKWNDATLDAVVAIVKEAKARAEPVSLRVGRAKSHVGFNRRLVNPKTGHVYMGVNREGPIVPWVNVLVADSRKSEKPLAVLFETAGHPVIVPHTNQLTSADYPGTAVKHVRKALGEDVIAIFGQGCGGNINGFPLRSENRNAESQGHDLGKSVLAAIRSSARLRSGTFNVRYARASLPSRSLPSEKEWKALADANKDDERRMEQLMKMRELIKRGEEPPSRRFDAYAVVFGKEWCLVTMPHEMFCQYELWVDRNAPFERTMTFGYTNGYEGYIGDDRALRMGPKGGYEAACLPNWGGQVWTRHFGPPAVGCEKIIQDTLSSLWRSSDGSGPGSD